MGRRYHDADWLRRKYHEEGLTQAEIAEECGVDPRTIRDWMNRHDIETRDLEGENHPLHGEERDESVKDSISETLTGREYPDEWRERPSDGLEGNEIPPEVREKISESLDGITRPEKTRMKMSRSTSGEQNPNWKGGPVTGYGPGWDPARRAVRERDQDCQHCGHDGSDRRLEVHHIVPVRRFKSADDVPLREAHDLSNLVLLCSRCHGMAEAGSIEFESGVKDPLDDE